MTGRLLIQQLDYAWVMSLPMRSEVSEVYGALKRGASTSSPRPPRCWPSPCFFRSLRSPSSSGTAGHPLSADALGQIWAAVRNPEAANHERDKRG